LTYADRNSLLLRLGYASYPEYLKSQTWATIRKLVAIRFHHQCPICHSPAKKNHIHHLNYNEDTLLGENLFALVLLCEECHKAVEFFPDGTKRPLASANAEYYRLLKADRPKKSIRKLRKSGWFKRLARLQNSATVKTPVMVRP
jgi:5-methylcytosine-specific restriction endonuclease McrA